MAARVKIRKIPEEERTLQNMEITWQAGGQQGEGLESLGAILAAALSGQGYNLYGFRQFSSRIKVDIPTTKSGLLKSRAHGQKKCDLLLRLTRRTLTSEARR